MPVPTYIGLSEAELIEEVPGEINFNGVDRLVQVWEMRQSQVAAFVAARRQDQNPLESIHLSTLSDMYLRNVMMQGGGNPFSRVTLVYEGFLVRRGVNQPYVDLADDITQQSSTVPTDTGESVAITYNAQQTSYRWFSSTRPNQPRFPMTVPSSVLVNQIFDYSPVNYTGDILIKYVGRLASFNRIQLAPNAWAVIETWIRRIEGQ